MYSVFGGRRFRFRRCRCRNHHHHQHYHHHHVNHCKFDGNDKSARKDLYGITWRGEHIVAMFELLVESINCPLFTVFFFYLLNMAFSACFCFFFISVIYVYYIFCYASKHTHGFSLTNVRLLNKQISEVKINDENKNKTNKWDLI